MSTTEQIRERLTARLAELANRAESLEAELSKPLEADSEEQASARENEETMEALEEAALQEIEQIRGALTRLDNGHYGVCAKCGEDIAPARLEAVPSATRCINCASA